MNFVHRIVSSFTLMALSASSAFADTPCDTGLGACEVPEPGSLSLMLVGLVGAVAVVRYFKKK